MFVYCLNLLLAALAYTILQLCIVAAQGRGSDLGRAVGSDVKGKISLVVYAAAMAVTFVQPLAALAAAAAVAAMWLVPDRRIEKSLGG